MDVAPAQITNNAGERPPIPAIESSAPVEDPEEHPEHESLAKRIRLVRDKGWEDGNQLLMNQITSAGDEKRTEGFVYKYRNGEVAIVCNCHGLFLTPAEFLDHATVVDANRPMKHIAIYSNPAPF